MALSVTVSSALFWIVPTSVPFHLLSPFLTTSLSPFVEDIALPALSTFLIVISMETSPIGSSTITISFPETTSGVPSPSLSYLIVPSFKTSNEIGSASLYPSGASNSFITYLPTARFTENSPTKNSEPTFVFPSFSYI